MHFTKFQSFKIFWKLIYGPAYGLSWWAISVHLKKNVYSVAVGYSVCQLGQLGW